MTFRVRIGWKDGDSRLFAEMLDKKAFQLTNKSTLGGVLLKPVLSIPHMRRENDCDLGMVYTFRSRAKDGFSELVVGEIYDLDSVTEIPTSG